KGKRLAADMLNYGAAAQLAFGENVEHLVNKDEDGNDIEILEYFDTDELPSATATTSQTEGSVSLMTSAALGNRVQLTVTGIFTGSDPVYLWVKNLETGVEYGPIETESAGSNPSTNRYGWRGYFDGVGAKNMRTMMEVTMRDEAGNVVSNTVTWSVEAMVNESVNSSSTSQVMKDLLYAMLTYGDSAAEYLAK
ncbi:MAG: hypothetical protein J5865_08055, partial [Lachnospiraceae bacterium]|nr:hypothetical protein [Lachnospiraceae bacterium]